MRDSEWVVLGLGNPARGPCRVNVGEMAVDAIAGGASFRRLGSLLLCSMTIREVGVTLLKASVFMERVGPTIVDYLHTRHIPPTRMIVLHDDAAALDVGMLRIRTRGAAGDHRGMLSIQKALPPGEGLLIPRIRIGTGLPRLASPRDDFTDPELARLDVIFRGVAMAIGLLVTGRNEAAMSLYNRRDVAIDAVPGLVPALDTIVHT